jgi:competence protein ComEA
MADHASSPVPAQPPALPIATRSRRAHIALACLVVVACGLLAKNVVTNTAWRARPTELTEDTQTHRCLDLNHASKAELLQVPGVGEKTVDHILEYRSRQRFRSVDDLMQVGGIRERSLDKLRRYFWVEPENEQDGVTVAYDAPNAANESPMSGSSKDSTVKRSTTSHTKKSNLTQIVNINTADAEELATLEGVGATRAADIIRERAKAPFKSVDELTRVKGIKQATLEKIRPRATVGDPPVAAKAE